MGPGRFGERRPAGRGRPRALVATVCRKPVFRRGSGRQPSSTRCSAAPVTTLRSAFLFGLPAAAVIWNGLLDYPVLGSCGGLIRGHDRRRASGRGEVGASLSVPPVRRKRRQSLVPICRHPPENAQSCGAYGFTQGLPAVRVAFAREFRRRIVNLSARSSRSGRLQFFFGRATSMAVRQTQLRTSPRRGARRARSSDRARAR